MSVIDIIKKEDGLDLKQIRNHPKVERFVEFPYGYILFYYYDKILEKANNELSAIKHAKLFQDSEFKTAYSKAGKEMLELTEKLETAFSEKGILIAGGDCQINDNYYFLKTTKKSAHIRIHLECGRIESDRVRIEAAFKKSKKDGTKAFGKILGEWAEWGKAAGNIESIGPTGPCRKGLEAVVSFSQNIEDSLAGLFWIMNETRRRTNLLCLKYEDFQEKQEKIEKQCYPHYAETYTSITLNHTPRFDIAALLVSKKHRAVISPCEKGFTVVYDVPESGFVHAAQHLSKKLKCTAVRVTNIKNDILMIHAYDKGKKLFSYNSNPDHFKSGSSQSPPQGADAPAICQVLGCPASAEKIADILHAPISDYDEFANETDRHEAFARCLGFPPFSVGYSHESFNLIIPDLNEEDFICINDRTTLRSLKEEESRKETEAAPYPYCAKTYTTVTLNHTEPSDIADFLTRKKHMAVVSPCKDGFTTVYDTAESGSDAAPYLSEKLGCTAVRVTNVKDDVLLIDVYDKGKSVARYNSNPDYLSFDDSHSPPQGADAPAICHAMGRSALAREINAILCAPVSTDGDFISETERHAAFAECLELPSFSVGFSYECLTDGDFPIDLNEDELIYIKSK